MRKILSVFILFSLLSAGSARFSSAEPGDLPETTGLAEVRHDDGHFHPQDGRNTPAPDFLQDVAANPVASADATIANLKDKKPDEILQFRTDNRFHIWNLIRALDQAADENRISPEDYKRISEDLKPYKILTIKAREEDGQGRGPDRGRFGPPPDNDDRLDKLVDMSIANKTRDKQKTAQAIETARTTYPDEPSVQVAAASIYNENKDFKMAEKAATDAIALDDSNPDAYKTRALARASLEDRKGAIEDIKKAMAINPQDESARVLAVLLESRKAVPSLKSISSVEEIKKALGTSEESPDAVSGTRPETADAAGGAAAAGGALAAPDFTRSQAYLKTALAKNSLGDHESAARYATLAIEKDPSNFEAYLERANADNFLGRYDDAVRDTSLVIEKDPSNLQAFNMRAWALTRKGQAQDAASDASRAIGLNPNFADAWYNRALAYEKQGDYKRMLEDYKQAASLSGAYSSRYQDAVAQYGPRVPGFASIPAGARAASRDGAGFPDGRNHSPLRRFLTLLFFTLTGGALVAMGLIHIMTGKRDEAPASARVTHPDVLSPSVFYEGVATGKYKIERKLGEGGMGVVYEATDQSLGRKVAIKKMNEEIKVNEREKQRFLDEARTVALLHHPNIVEIYTIFEEEDNIYLVFEHVDGVTLDHVLDKEARLPFERAREIIGATAGALAYAHSKNVVHRDLKLSNIMISAEDGVKVMDFGLARRALESRARFSNAEVVGSPAYMAPEQELGASSVESDIYSLGVCFYEAVSGVLPFQGPDFHTQKTHRSYQALTDILPGLPKGVDELVARCLAPEPENRFRSAEEFRRALDVIA